MPNTNYIFAAFLMKFMQNFVAVIWEQEIPCLKWSLLQGVFVAGVLSFTIGACYVSVKLGYNLIKWL